MSAKSKLRLDQLLVDRGLADSRTKAAAIIMAGAVNVDGRPQTKAGQLVEAASEVTVTGGPAYVSRGGDKLASVADALGLQFEAKSVLDVGASAGGFSDYALGHGAARVVALDVGHGQLDLRLRQDPRVEVLERTDIREFHAGSRFDLALVDVSFISVLKVIEAVWRQVKPSGQVVVMVKPQFEADKAVADRFKGVIDDETVRQQILADVRSRLSNDYKIAAEADSQVLGPKGNREHFMLLQLN